MWSCGPVRWLDSYDTHAIMCARYYTSCCIQQNCPMHFIARSQALKMLSSTLPIALEDALQAYLTIPSQVSSQHCLKHTPEYTLQYTPNCTRWHTPSLLDCVLPSKLSRQCQAHSWARFQVHSPVARYSQSHFTICSHICSWVLDPETNWVTGARHLEVGGRRRLAAAEIMTSIDIIVWTTLLARPPWEELTIPHGNGVENCSMRFCRKGRQLDLGESRSPTQIFQWNQLLTSHWLWVYVYAFGADDDDGDGGDADDGDGDNRNDDGVSDVDHGSRST